MQIPEKSRLRYDALTDDSKKEFLSRYKRLRKQFLTPENAALFSSGYCPEDIRKWTPAIRYRLAQKMNSTGLIPGTLAYQNRQAEAIQEIKDWLSGWFERNHEWR